MKPDYVHLLIKDFLRDGECYHYAQTTLTPVNTARYHDHDFHEIFWVLEGRGEHRWNDGIEPVKPGQLFLICPKDRHYVTGDRALPLRIANLAFPSRAWRDVRRRYFADEADWFAQPRAQRVRALESGDLDRLARWEVKLAAAARPQVSLDGFLMELPGFLRPAVANAAQAVPEWLVDARRAIELPDHFCKGTREFARLSRRSPAHLARATYRYFGVTPTDLMNDARMTYSAAQLLETPRPIMEIALDCGFNNLSHFYTLFKKRHGVTPRKYRLQARSPVRV